MNQKETGELRRRFRPEKSGIRRIYGCYVNSGGEVISQVDAPLSMMPQEEAEQYLGLLKKTMSGTPGKNLLEIEFTVPQVISGEEHRLLSALRQSELKDAAAQEEFYRRVVSSLDLEAGNWLVLLAHDSYDVPYRDANGETRRDASDEVFSYIVCCVCPVKDGKAGLGFCPGENEFHNLAASQMVGPPELGFLFPAFTDRATDLYAALYYTRQPQEVHPGFLKAVFGAEPPMSSVEQQEAFHTALAGVVAGSEGLEVAQAVHEELTERIHQHKESHSPQPLTVSVREVGGILEGCGVAEERVAAFCESCEQQFGKGADLSPANLIDPKRFEIKTDKVTISVPPDQSSLVETRVIDGQRYLLIPVSEELTVNGMPVG